MENLLNIILCIFRPKFTGTAWWAMLLETGTEEPHHHQKKALLEYREVRIGSWAYSLIQEGRRQHMQATGCSADLHHNYCLQKAIGNSVMQWLLGKSHLPSFLLVKQVTRSFGPTAPPSFCSYHNSRPPQHKEHHSTQTELHSTKRALPLVLY